MEALISLRLTARRSAIATVTVRRHGRSVPTPMAAPKPDHRRRPQGMRRQALGTFAFFVAAPGTMAGLVPWLVTGWEGSPPGWDAVDVLGLLFGLVGLAMVVACFVRFVREGRGTPAPAAPTEALVVGGLYRYLRNPMYVGVGLAIAGQCLAFRSLPLVAWLALFTVAVAAFVIGYEQPTLRARYGASYDAYRRSVPAVVPRLRRRARATPD
jgi:protein-S-isoprenylcysteine O-methyltransferase Ste14